MHQTVEVNVGVGDQEVHAEGRTGTGEDRRQAGPGCAGVGGHHFAQHAQQLGRHLLGADESPARIGIDGAVQQPTEGVVPGQHRVIVGQAVHIPALTCSQVQRQRGQGAPHGVDVGGDRGSGADDLGRLVAGGAVEVPEGVDPRNRTEVDELELLLGHHDVLRLEVVVAQADRVQVAQRRQDLKHVGDRHIDRQSLALLGFQGFAADVLHHDVADRFAAGVGVLDEVEDLHDRGMRDLGQELALRHGHRLRFGVARVHQALEHHRPLVDVAVDRQIHPAESAVRNAALDQVLLGDQVAGTQLRQERVRTAAVRAGPL